MDAALAGAVLGRLGIEPPPVTLGGLAAVYLRWCHTVPFDNLRKRRWLADGATGPAPGAEPSDFFESFVRHGTGGTCWPTSGALTELLLHLGFDARRVASSMLPFPDVPNRPNHGTTIVRLADEQYLVDSSMLTETPVPLVPGQPSTGGDGITSARTEPHGDLWRAYWKPWRGGPDEMPCEMEDDAFDHEGYVARYHASTEFSPFNRAVYARKNHPEGIRLVMGADLVEVDRDGGIRTTDVSDRRPEVLVELFGFSPEIVEAVPPDEPGPPPPRGPVDIAGSEPLNDP